MKVISRVCQLVRRATHESVMLAFGAFALLPAATPTDEGPLPVLRVFLAHTKPSQWYGSAQDSRHGRDEALAHARYAIGGRTDPLLTFSLRPGARIVTQSDLSVRNQSLFLNPYGPRSPP